MTPKEFIKKFYPFAKEVEQETEIPALAIMAQAALESGWGKSAIGNNLFGIKYRKGDPGYREVVTTEYGDSPFLFKGQNIKSVIYIKSLNKYMYKLTQYFADYPTPKDGFMAHARLLLTPRYKHALRWKYSPARYMIAVWRSGYATDPKYPQKICSIIDSVKRRLPREQIKMDFIEPKTMRL
jgi:flagellum-specific peptidoglycan hydrolase FlgJ